MDRRFQMIAGAVVGIVVLLVIMFTTGVFNGSEETPDPTETTISTTAPDTTVATTPDIPAIPDPTDPAETDPSVPDVSIPDDDILTPGEGEDPDPTAPEATEPKEDAVIPDTPVVEPVVPVDPTEPEDDVVVGGDNEAPPFSCGDPNHHCANEYAHAMVANRELEGCEMCGSHSCPSFYAVDEWGQGTYDPSLCPEYDVHKDPVHYCQACGKPTGDGTGGTCVFFVVDTQCPHCGKDVDAWECHSCK